MCRASGYSFNEYLCAGKLCEIKQPASISTVGQELYLCISHQILDGSSDRKTYRIAGFPPAAGTHGRRE